LAAVARGAKKSSGPENLCLFFSEFSSVCLPARGVRERISSFPILVFATMSSSKKILIVTTSHALLGKTGYPTGVWLSEVAHPYHVLSSAGYHVDIASVKGGNIPVDPYSEPSKTGDQVSADFLKDAEASKKMQNSIALSNVDVTAYAAVIFAGGNGAVFDFPHDKNIAKFINSVLDRPNAVLSTLCHGGAALLGVERDGVPLVKGLDVTAFDNEEEELAGKAIGVEYLPFYLETELTKAGATFSKSTPFSSHTAITYNGRIITGQNNFSGEEVGKKVLEFLKRQA
jgi:putative intracellular protease/amidase